jgi:hypothetical protein
MAVPGLVVEKQMMLQALSYMMPRVSGKERDEFEDVHGPGVRQRITSPPLQWRQPRQSAPHKLMQQPPVIDRRIPPSFADGKAW